MTTAVGPYWFLIEAFVEDRLSAPEFESLYLRLFQYDPTRWHELYDILHPLFTDVDAYTSDALLRGPGDLDDRQLKEQAVKAKKALEEVVPSEYLPTDRSPTVKDPILKP